MKRTFCAESYTFSFYDELLYSTSFVTTSSYFYINIKICNSKVQENIVVILLFVCMYVALVAP